MAFSFTHFFSSVFCICKTTGTTSIVVSFKHCQGEVREEAVEMAEDVMDSMGEGGGSILGSRMADSGYYSNKPQEWRLKGTGLLDNLSTKLDNNHHQMNGLLKSTFNGLAPGVEGQSFQKTWMMVLLQPILSWSETTMIFPTLIMDWSSFLSSLNCDEAEELINKLILK